VNSIPAGESVDVFHGRVTPHAAWIYARVEHLPGGQEWTLSGKLRGPLCQGVRTLPTTVELRDLGHGPVLLAGATILDPAFWSLDLPAHYEAHVVLRRGPQVVAEVSQWFGIRWLGVTERNLRWQANRWVIRGVRTPEPDLADLTLYAHERLTLVVTEPTEGLLRAASQNGVLVVAECRGANVAACLRWLARWPAVGLVLVPDVAAESQTWSSAAPNTLLAQQLRSAHALPADWSQVIFVDATQPERLRWFSSSCPLPVVATRQLHEPCSVSEARGACDQLQRDLAQVGSFAGYVIDVPAVLG